MQDTTKSSELNEFLTRKGYNPISIKKEVSGHLMVHLTINGIPGKFMIDTGAGVTIVEEKQAEKFKLMLTKSKETAAGAGGMGIELRTSAKNNVQISDYAMESLPITVMNLDHVLEGLKELDIHEIDGIVGADILSEGKGIIDYNNLVLYLSNN